MVSPASARARRTRPPAYEETPATRPALRGSSQANGPGRGSGRGRPRPWHLALEEAFSGPPGLPPVQSCLLHGRLRLSLTVAGPEWRPTPGDAVRGHQPAALPRPERGTSATASTSDNPCPWLIGTRTGPSRVAGTTNSVRASANRIPHPSSHFIVTAFGCARGPPQGLRQEGGGQQGSLPSRLPRHGRGRRDHPSRVKTAQPSGWIMVAPSSEGDGPVEVRETGCPHLLGT